MKSYKHIPIITDITAFEERVDEITSTTDYETVKHTISSLKKALYANPDCAALCAPQIGVDLRLFVVKTAKSESQRFHIFLNPLIISSEGLHLSRETNPSLPNKQFIIPRKDKVHVAFQKEDGKVDSETYFGAYGEVVQQMIEMLDGITLADYGLDLDDIGGPAAYDKATKKQQVEIMAMYLESLKLDSAALTSEIEESPELKNLNDTIDFMAGMLKGDITPLKERPDADKVKKD